MKSVKRLFCLSILTFFLSICTQAQSETLRLVTEPWSPWIIKGKNNVASGPFIDITKAVFRKAGVKYDIKFFPWKRCLHRIAAGESDVILMIVMSPEREKTMAFSEGILTDALLVYHRKSNPFEWKTFDDFKGIKVGVTQGFDYGKSFNAAVQKHGIKLEATIRDELNIKKLFASRMDVAIMNQTITNDYLKANPQYHNIVAAKKPFKHSVYRIAFSKKSKYLNVIPRINTAIAALEEAGTIDKIVLKAMK